MDSVDTQRCNMEDAIPIVDLGNLGLLNNSLIRLRKIIDYTDFSNYRAADSGYRGSGPSHNGSRYQRTRFRFFYRWLPLHKKSWCQFRIGKIIL